MNAKAIAKLNTILIDGTQRLPPNLLLVIIISEGKAALSPQQTMIGMTTIKPLADGNHGSPRTSFAAKNQG